MQGNAAQRLAKRRALGEVLRGSVGWTGTVIVIASAALLARLLIIDHSHGGSNLAIWTYFSRLALHGSNPFHPPASAPIRPIYSNSPPLEVAVFAGLLAIHDSPTTLRLAFALTDVAVLLLIGFCFPRPRGWRVAFMLFYAFNPYVLLAWTVFAQDKSLLFFGIAALLLSLERGREWCAWAALTALAAFKFLGAFAAPAVALHWLRERRRWAVLPIAAFVIVLLLSNLPWFPQSLDAFSRRNALLAINPPIHVSPTILLARLGIYAPIEPKLFSAAAIIAVLGFFLADRIDVSEAVVWSLLAGYIFLPDDDYDRLLLITLPFLLILDLSTLEWALMWVVSSVAALAGVIATRGVPHELSALAGPLHTVFGAHEATLRNMLWLNLLPALTLAFYFMHRHAGSHRRLGSRPA